MAIKNFVMNNDGSLTIDVDTIIQPGVLGIASPTLTLVQAIDFIGYDEDVQGALPKIKEYDSTSQTLADFGIVNKINVQTVSPLPDAQTKYSGVAAGSKLFSTQYPLSIDGDIRNEVIEANTKTGYCVRIRTVMMDESISSSPRLPNTIAEFNQVVLSLGTSDSISNFHNQYYSCVSIPVNVVAGQFLFVDPLVYYDWGSKTDQGIAVTGTSTKSVIAPIQLKLSWGGYQPTADVTQSGNTWTATINDTQDSYLYVGPGATNEIWESKFDTIYKNAEGNTVATVNADSVGRLPIASRCINSSVVPDVAEHAVTDITNLNRTYDKLPPVVIDLSTGIATVETVIKLNRQDEVDLNGNDLRIWARAYVIPHSVETRYKADIISNPEIKLGNVLVVYDLLDLWEGNGRRTPYSTVFPGQKPDWQIVKVEIPMPNLVAEVQALRDSSGDTNTDYVVMLHTIVGRDNHNPPVPWPTDMAEYDTYFKSNVNYDYRNVTYLSMKVPYVAVEDEFTLNDVTFYEYGGTSNRTLIISGTATGEVTKDNLVIEGFSNTSGDFVPLNIESVYVIENVWWATVTNPNPALRIVPITNEYGEYFGTEIKDVMKASYTSSITGAVKQSGNKNITMRGPIMTRVVNMDSPATTHNIVYNRVVEYGLFKPMLPYARFDAPTNTFSLDVVVKTKNPDEIAAMGADMKLWIKLELEALGVGESKYSKGPYIYLDEPIGTWTDYDTGVTRTTPVYTVGKTLHIVPNLWAIWNNPYVSKPYSDKFPDAPDNAKNWRILTIEVPIGDISSEIAAARASTGNVETDLLVAIETFMARTDMDLPAPYPSTFDGFTEDYYSNFQFPAERDDQRRISYLKVNIPMSTPPEPEPTPEETFTLDKPYYYEYGSTANPTVVISGTASGPISAADLSVSVLDGNYVEQPLTVSSVNKVGDKWTAVVSDPNVRKMIPGQMHKAYLATDYTTNLFTKLETVFRYTSPTSGQVWEISWNDFNVHCPTQTRAVNIDSPRTTHDVINSFRGRYPSEIGHTGWWSDLPYARLDLDTGVLSVDVIVKLVKPEEIALNGNGLKLWVRTQMDVDTSLSTNVSFDAKALAVDNLLTLNKALAVIDNLGDIWNDPTKVQSYISKFPDAPVEAKDWKIVKVDIPLGSNFKTDTNAARTALGFGSLPTTDLKLTIHTFIGRTDMSRTPPYPDTIEAFNKAFLDSLRVYPYTLANENDLVMRSYLKVDLPV